jgi:hypothetical protein
MPTGREKDMGGREGEREGGREGGREKETPLTFPTPSI